MIYERVVYISMHTSRLYLHLARPSINDPANKWWSVNAQLLIISDNESLWRLINIWSATVWTFISSRRPRGNGCAIDARGDLYPGPSCAIIQSAARPGTLRELCPSLAVPQSRLRVVHAVAVGDWLETSLAFGKRTRLTKKCPEWWELFTFIMSCTHLII